MVVLAQETHIFNLLTMFIYHHPFYVNEKSAFENLGNTLPPLLVVSHNGGERVWPGEEQTHNTY